MKYLVRSDAVLTDAVFLLVRLCVGVVFIAHGWEKVAGQGLAATIEGNRELGIPLPELSGAFLAYGELIGGALLVLGVATRAGAAALTVIMLGAWVFVHGGSGLMLQNGGFEYVMVLAAVSLLVLAYGPGRFSIDAVVAERFGAAEPAARTAGDRAGAAG
ncbi:DoxX family protein [Streptomonospora sp. PA3]|uniref:DoxX family protein n=1 Tax=Streptomonospora sp. PA3 TaxID=2607326 RepID=UPI0012DC7393|nr:DoxX family protein [Streptomonospora sp. PA3]MUL44040.1 DoxX family protein [Streptomonospora sp. PA3]